MITLANNIDTTVNGTVKVHIDNPIHFEVIRSIPKEFRVQIEDAVDDFIRTHHIPIGVDAVGLKNQTFETIINAVHFGQGDFWLATRGDRVVGYCLARIVKDVDNRLTYWISQAWVSITERGKSSVKEAWCKIQDRAKNLLCAHIVIVSSRSPEAYCRFLGDGWNPYMTLLKKDLEG